MNFYYWRSLLLCICASLFVSCNADSTVAPQADGLTKVVLQTDWYAEPEHGGFYQALVKGYYREVGLDVEIRPIAPMTSIYSMIANRQAHFGLGTSDNLMVAMARDIPLVGVFPYFQHDPQGIMVHPESGITRLEELDGRTVMMSPALHYVDYLQSALDIRFQLIPLDGSVTRFVQDKDFIQQVFLTSEPYAAIQAGIEPVLLPFQDTGFDPYRLVFTRLDFALDNPGIVRAFITATMRGWKSYLTEDRSLVHAEIMARNPAQSPEFMQWTFDRMHEYQLLYGFQEQDETLGQINVARLQTQIDQLSALGLLAKPVTAEDVMLLELYPKELVITE